MEMERQQPSRTPEGNRPRDKDHGTRSMGQILSREEQPQESRRRTISFSSEEPYRRFFGMEILDHGENAVDLSRLNSVGVLLFNHNTDKVVGKVIRAWVENHRGMAEVEFDTDDDAEKDLRESAVRHTENHVRAVQRGRLGGSGGRETICGWAIYRPLPDRPEVDAAGGVRGVRACGSHCGSGTGRHGPDVRPPLRV